MMTRTIIRVAAMMAASAVYATTYYVDVARPNDAGDGLSWAKAKKTIQAAVDLASAGDTVLVTNGTYSQGGAVTPGYASSNRVVVTKDITVRSLNGPGVTVIQGQGPVGDSAVRGVYMSAGVLSGFTVQRGYTPGVGDLNYDLSGGGINMYGGNGVVSNCMISDNLAMGYGGGTYHGTASDCTIRRNTATEGGGTYGSTVNQCEIDNNNAHAGGGGAAYGMVRNSTINSNSVGLLGIGGGVYGSTVSNCTISGNYADNDASHGGGVGCGVVIGCSIVNNTASRYGGGVYASTVSVSMISGNTATDGGGAFESIVESSTISGNRAGGGGGGTYGGRVNNCVISGNTGHHGGGTCYSIVTNCTVVGNTATNRGGGTYWGTVVNSIVWDNSASISNNHHTTRLWYSCTLPLPGDGAGNITNDPQFLNAAAGNYRLAESSPCINAGTNAPGMAWQTDLDGNPRIYLGDGVGIVDMGCYEFVPEPVAGVALVVVLAGTWRRHVRR